MNKGMKVLSSPGEICFVPHHDILKNEKELCTFVTICLYVYCVLTNTETVVLSDLVFFF